MTDSQNISVSHFVQIYARDLPHDSGTTLSTNYTPKWPSFTTHSSKLDLYDLAVKVTLTHTHTHRHILAALNKSLQSLLCGRLIYITIYNSVNSSKWHRPLSKWYCWSVTPVIYTHTHFYETRRFTHVFPSSWNTFQDWGLYLPWTAGRTVEHLSCCTFEEWWYKTWLIALRNYCTKAVFWAFH